METLKGGIYITVKDIELLESCSYRNALRVMEEIREHFSKEKHKLTVEDYCTFNKVDFDVVVRYINPFR